MYTNGALTGAIVHRTKIRVLEFFRLHFDAEFSHLIRVRFLDRARGVGATPFALFLTARDQGRRRGMDLIQIIEAFSRAAYEAYYSGQCLPVLT